MLPEVHQHTADPKGEVTVLPQWLEHVAQFQRACQECRQELPFYWQMCACCDIRGATYCLGCGNSLPPTGSYACACCGLPMPDFAHQRSGNPHC